MPIPSKGPDEDKDKFVSRCMSDEGMKTEYKDSQKRVAICLGKASTNSSLISKVQDNLISTLVSWDDEWDEFVEDTDDIVWFEGKIQAETKGTKKTLNKPFRTSDGPKKFSVYVKNEKGNVVKVNFGDPNMEIKRDDPARRKSYRARHNCDTPGPKWKANYWSCKMWSRTNVSDLT